MGLDLAQLLRRPVFSRVPNPRVVDGTGEVQYVSAGVFPSSHRGRCSADSLINIALCCLGYLPGLAHAWYIILKYPEDLDDPAYAPIPQQQGHGAGPGRGRVISQDAEGGRVTYYYIAPPQRHAHRPDDDTPDPRVSPQQSGTIPHGQRAYGTAEQAGQAGQPGDSAAAGPSHGGGEEGRPPTYAEAIKGDHKIQHD
ncbi:hypothetical protein KEM52_005796 [Ascosphaera acerosa]|nr:hypothetical protein KEM52_005796 [Ascosphaera acerosa]